jgi:hypothetical protein
MDLLGSCVRAKSRWRCYTASSVRDESDTSFLAEWGQTLALLALVLAEGSERAIFPCALADVPRCHPSGLIAPSCQQCRCRYYSLLALRYGQQRTRQVLWALTRQEFLQTHSGVVPRL